MRDLIFKAEQAIKIIEHLNQTVDLQTKFLRNSKGQINQSYHNAGSFASFQWKLDANEVYEQISLIKKAIMEIKAQYQAENDDEDFYGDKPGHALTVCSFCAKKIRYENSLIYKDHLLCEDCNSKQRSAA